MSGTNMCKVRLKQGIHLNSKIAKIGSPDWDLDLILIHGKVSSMQSYMYASLES